MKINNSINNSMVFGGKNKMNETISSSKKIVKNLFKSGMLKPFTEKDTFIVNGTNKEIPLERILKIIAETLERSA